MTDVDLITAALAAGAAAGVTNTASAAITDTYQSLKGLISHKLASCGKSQKVLEVNVADPGAWQAHLSIELMGSGVAADEKILATARTLLSLTGTGGKYQIDLREARGVQVGDGNSQHITIN